VRTIDELYIPTLDPLRRPFATQPERFRRRRLGEVIRAYIRSLTLAPAI